MIKYKNLIIVGTSHIAKESIEVVKETIESEKPDVVAIELDKKRLLALLSKKSKQKLSLKLLFKVGIAGFLFQLLGSWAERKLGKLTGVFPGSEMIEAVKKAKQIEAKVALIDQDIEKTLKQVSKSMSIKEKIKFVLDLLKGLVKKEKIKFDLKKIPDEKTINELKEKFMKRYPNLYKVLVDKRNEHIGKNLYKLMCSFKKVVAVVGAGHEKEIISIVKECQKQNSMQQV